MQMIMAFWLSGQPNPHDHLWVMGVSVSLNIP